MKEMNLHDRLKFIKTPPPKGKVIQISIIRDKTGFKNKFYPKYHIHFS